MHFTLYCSVLCPISRFIRMILLEKQIAFAMIEEDFHSPSEEYLVKNPIGVIPALIIENIDGSTTIQNEDKMQEIWQFPSNNNLKKHNKQQRDNIVLGSIGSIVEFLEEYGNNPRKLINGDVFLKAHIRSTADYFNIKFFREISGHLIFQKIIIPHIMRGVPTSHIIRRAYKTLGEALAYVENILQDSVYMASNECTLADYAAAGQFAILDYMNEVNWSNYPTLKDWYANMKSRRVVRNVLLDDIPYLSRPTHYLDPDF